jgi:YggT family protein
MGLLIELIQGAVTLATLMIVVRAFWSWISPYPSNPLQSFVWNVTEPILAPVRALLPGMGGLDLSPLVAILLLQGLEYLLLRLLVG